MTPEQREARLQHQREQYALRRTKFRRVRRADLTPEQKRAKLDRQKERRKLQRNTLHPSSIAMENPLYCSSDDSVERPPRITKLFKPFSKTAK